MHILSGKTIHISFQNSHGSKMATSHAQKLFAWWFFTYFRSSKSFLELTRIFFHRFYVYVELYDINQFIKKSQRTNFNSPNNSTICVYFTSKWHIIWYYKLNNLVNQIIIHYFKLESNLLSYKIRVILGYLVPFSSVKSKKITQKAVKYLTIIGSS